jgi:hypothetical protein
MSVGPRSAIKKLIDIDLPRPRDLANPRFARLFSDIEDLMTPDLISSEERLELH